MSIGTWFAYCDRDRLVQLPELLSTLAANPNLTFALESGDLLVVTVHDALSGNRAEITITMDIGPHVLLEAAELADENLPLDDGVPPPDPDILRGANARYELHWDLRFSDETYNPMVKIAGVLVRQCDAIIFDVTNHRFV